MHHTKAYVNDDLFLKITIELSGLASGLSQKNRAPSSPLKCLVNIFFLYQMIRKTNTI